MTESAAPSLPELNLNGSLLQITLFEDRLTSNFQNLNLRIKKLEVLDHLEGRLKTTEKEVKFLTQKLNLAMQMMPKDIVKQADVKTIAKQAVLDVLHNSESQVSATSSFTALREEIEALRSSLVKIDLRVGDDFGTQQRPNTKSSFTAAQMRTNNEGSSQSKRISKESLQDLLDPKQVDIVSGMLGGVATDQAAKQQAVTVFTLATKIEDMAAQLEALQHRSSLKKELQKIEKFDHYEKKQIVNSNKKNQAEKSIRVDAVRKDQVRGQILKNDLYSQHNKAEMLRTELNKQQQQNSLEPIQKRTLLNSQSNFMINKDESVIRIEEGISDEPRNKKIKSLVKLDRNDKKLRVEELKDINGVLREVEVRIDGRVSHQIFMGFVQDIEQKLQILRVTKDFSIDISQLRRTVYSVQARLQSVLAFMSSSANDDDALIVKKQWACASCDRSVQRFAGKVGQHINWESISSKKMSPMKAGAFGQTGQLATKIKNMLEGGAKPTGE